MSNKVAGLGPGERRLNGEQTTGREYRNLSTPDFGMRRTNDVGIAMRDGTELMADLFQPDADGRFPALLSFSPYPRQIQDVGAPLGFIEAGASDFFVPRGYVHLIANARGTGGSGGTWGLFDRQERDDLFDLVEWAAAQPWCDGKVGMLGISYFAMAQLEAAVTKPPHLKAIAPLLTTDDLYEAAYHHGLLNAGFISAWLPAIGVMSERPDAFWRGDRIGLARDILNIPAIHARMQHLDGEAIVTVLKDVIHAHPPAHYDDLWRAVAVEHPARDGFWQERNLRPLLGSVDIPVYLGADWDNVPLHLPSTFGARKALRHNPNVRMALLPPGGFAWPWEALHVEVLAWYDQWLKGRYTGVMEGPPIRWQMPGAEGWRTAPDWPPAEARLTPFALCADGTLCRDEGEPGSIAYLYLPADSGVPANANPPDLPAYLGWETTPFDEAVEIAGNIELVLDASITALDTGWIAVLYDVPPKGAAEPITAGWLRASLRTVDEDASVPGAPVVGCATPVAVPVGERVTYRIPMVPNARHLPAAHGLRLVIASADEPDKYPTVLGFTHVPLREASQNTVFSASRLLLPLLPASGIVT
ncbi:MAG: CocE/NonD family hydrolase [Amaricoccus sp.]|uniref:CocE/NonD family hydrolase n=1 Tax=Amaricoccus sp. TaxID=1872485 RepID=UPI003315C50B